MIIMENENLKSQANKIIEQLTAIKSEFLKDKEELSLSIRRDTVSVELKDILNNYKDYSSLKQAIEEYIKNLFKIRGE